MLHQKLQQKLQQKFSPQQMQLMLLLHLPIITLEQRIKQEIEENIALEEGVEEEENDQINDDDDAFENSSDDEGKDNDDDEFNLDDYLDDEDTFSNKYTISNTNSDDEKTRKEIPFSVGDTFQELLLQQLGLRVLDDKQYLISSHIIGNLDDSGYLVRDINAIIDDLVFLQNINTTVEEITTLLKIIQEFDPPGIGARNLRECLLLQINRKNINDTAVKNAIIILENYFDEFTKKHYDKIQKNIGLSDVKLKEAVHHILLLNPKPGNTQSESSKTIQYIIPDFIITNNNGELELTLTSGNIPDIRISRVYSKMYREYSKNKKNEQQKKILSFIKQKIESAIWFIDAIKQRQNILFVTMEAIMNYQRNYFLKGDEALIKPMILKDISEKTGLDITIISRVSNSKYVQTSYGTFRIKKFFSESLSTDSGEKVSTIKVKRILRDCIEKENKKKPTTDDNLSKILKEKGYNIVRRTIAKYRKQLNIPIARLRKEL